MSTDEPYVSTKRGPTKEEIRLIKRYGRSYPPALLPADVRPGRLGWCFDESMRAVLDAQTKYRYVEGIAKVPGEDKGWILHAWITDGVHAFDPTWRGDPVAADVKYIGIEMPLLTVILFVKRTGYQGVIPNRARYPHALESVIAGLQ